MEYTKDVRTDNLTLRDIHVGDWVQVWSETAERYSPPLKIIQICDDGTIYLVTSDEERPTPWEENIKNVDALPITPELLIGFGFEAVEGRPELLAEVAGIWPGFLTPGELEGWTIFTIYYNKISIGYTIESQETGICSLCSPTSGIYTNYAHKLFNELNKYKDFENVSFEWKGLDKNK